jgi:hypothetical protein
MALFLAAKLRSNPRLLLSLQSGWVDVNFNDECYDGTNHTAETLQPQAGESSSKGTAREKA